MQYIHNFVSIVTLFFCNPAHVAIDFSGNLNEEAIFNFFQFFSRNFVYDWRYTNELDPKLYKTFFCRQLRWRVSFSSSVKNFIVPQNLLI